MRKGLLIAVAAVALFGAAVAAISTSQHLRLQREGFEEASFCAISERINCDIVNASSYAELFGVPTAWWGLAFYVLVAGMALVAAFVLKDGRATVMAAWIMAAGSLPFSAFLAYVAAVILGVVCLECLAMYAANLALAILLSFALPVRRGGIRRFFLEYAKAVFRRPSAVGFSPRVVTHAIVVLAIFGASAVAIKAVQGGGKGEGTATAKEKVDAFFQQSLAAMEQGAGWAVWGNPDAKVTIVEFSDFQCPFCRVSAFNLRPHLQEFRNDVRFSFANFPLDSGCNPSIENAMHPFSCLAARASICAAKRGQFWSFHDDLFRHQDKLSEEKIYDLAGQRGWGREDFEACVEDPETEALLQRDIAAARKIYVSGTPTVFVSGRKLKYWRDPSVLQAVVREEIRRSKGGKPSS